MDVKDIGLRLHEIGAVSFGVFTLKSGLISPFYLDIRRIIAYPDLLRAIGDEMVRHILENETSKPDLVCGVPYTALPIATSMSLSHNIPMCMRRKEPKNYGTKKIIEGIFQPGQRVAVIEDIVTSGGSVLETCHSLEEAGLVVDHVSVVVDREQGGKRVLEDAGYKIYCLLGIRALAASLLKNRRIEAGTAAAIEEFIGQNRFD